jgi:hypothetical protein
VPYSVIVAAADRSIQRFAETKTWPGLYPAVQSGSAFTEEELQYNSTASLSWEEWDFVPDGLLVWEAWLHWIQERNTKSK